MFIYLILRLLGFLVLNILRASPYDIFTTVSKDNDDTKLTTLLWLNSLNEDLKTREIVREECEISVSITQDKFLLSR